MNIAIIPARSGSKRIPQKNIKEFHGKPLISYSIETAISSNCFEKILVSTDDQHIVDIARDNGAEAPFIRPSRISDDHSTTMDVMAHALNWCDDHKWIVDNVCCIYATAPFLLPEYLIEGLTLLEQNQSTQFVFSATTFSFPIQRALKIGAKQEVSMFYPEHESTRSQDLEQAYHDAGQFYWGRKKAFQNKLSIFSNHSKTIQIPRKRVQDIDTQEDWELAEALYLALSL